MERMRLTSLVFRLEEPVVSALKKLALTTRVRQSEYLREALSDELSKLEQLLESHRPVELAGPGGAVGGSDVHVLVPTSAADRLKTLSLKTRVAQSELLRSAVARLLTKYERTAP